MKITNNIKKYRIQKKLTQKELAEKSSISERQLIEIEKGSQDPRISTVIKIALSLEKGLEDLFPLPSEKTSPSKITQQNDITKE